jgi:hypothetical protein
MRSPKRSPRVAVNDEGAAAHAVHAAGQGTRGEIADVARHREHAARHFAGGQQAGTAFDAQLAAVHAAARIVARMAVDANAAAVHLPADAVEALEVALEMQHALLARRDVEQLGQRKRLVAVAHGQLPDLRSRELRKRSRHDATQIDAQDGHLPQPEMPSAHNPTSALRAAVFALGAARRLMANLPRQAACASGNGRDPACRRSCRRRCAVSPPAGPMAMAASMPTRMAAATSASVRPSITISITQPISSVEAAPRPANSLWATSPTRLGQNASLVDAIRPRTCCPPWSPSAPRRRETAG